MTKPNKPYPLYDVPALSSLVELVAYVADTYGGKPAFSFERGGQIVDVSYRQFAADVDALAGFLVEEGYHDAKIAIIGENSYEWILTYFAVVNSGNVIVPIDKELPEADIRHIVDHSDAEVLVYSDDLADVAVSLRGNGAAVHRYVPMSRFLSVVDEQAQTHRAAAGCRPSIDSRAPAALLYTSGTTGAPKAAMLTHVSLMADTTSASQLLQVPGSSLLVLPLHHSFGSTAGVLAMLLQGCRVCVNHSLRTLLPDLKRFEPTTVCVVPLFVETFYKTIWDTARQQRKDRLLRYLIKLSNAMLRIGIDLRRLLFRSVLSAFGGELRLLISGGAPLDARYAQGMVDFGVDVVSGYGITECSPIVSLNRNHYQRDGGVGLVVPGTDVRIAEPDPSGRGEIQVRGDIVMLGYYKDPEASAAAFDGEWFRTGDIGHLDDDGFLFITGRKKNLIILSNGENVAPEPLEAALLNTIPYIKEAVIYGHEDVIVAEVFLDDTVPDGPSRLDHDVATFNLTQPSYKQIGKIVVRDTEFPKTTTKKIRRRYANEGDSDA